MIVNAVDINMKLFLLLSTLTLGSCSNLFPRIFNGDEVKQVIPYVAALKVCGQNNKCSDCTATLITKRIALTAASCILDVSGFVANQNMSFFKTFNVAAGSLNKNNASSIRVVDYKLRILNSRADLAVLKLETCFTNPKVAPIDLAGAGYTYKENQTVFTSGWGQKDVFSLDSVDTLRSIHTTIFSYKVCQKAIHGFLLTNYCTFSKRRGLCQSDAGAPLVDERSGKNLLIGIYLRSRYLTPIDGQNRRVCGVDPDIYVSIKAVLASFIEPNMKTFGYDKNKQECN